jgi:tetratricopeptide (TPR) repeat protein
VARLQALERDVRAVLDGLEADEQQRTMPTAAARALARAERLLARGKYEEAVRDSHRAWQHAPDDPDVFDAMIEIHCNAAAGDGAEQRHADAIRWLLCAHGHDRSNQRVRDLLADRQFAQASEFADEHRHDEALRAIDACLTWRSDYPDAQELQQALRGLL